MHYKLTFTPNLCLFPFPTGIKLFCTNNAWLKRKAFRLGKPSHRTTWFHIWEKGTNVHSQKKGYRNSTPGVLLLQSFQKCIIFHRPFHVAAIRNFPIFPRSPSTLVPFSQIRNQSLRQVFHSGGVFSVLSLSCDFQNHDHLNWVVRFYHDISVIPIPIQVKNCDLELFNGI